MLINIFNSNKLWIAFTYAVLTVEETLISFIPLFLGLALDSMLEGSSGHMWLYVSVIVTSLSISVLRRLWDTRFYVSIWSRLASDRINTMIIKGIDRSKIVSRTHMLIEYTRFYEYSLPMALTAGIDMAISLGMLFYFMPKVSVAIVIILSLALLSQYLMVLAQQRVDNEKQLTSEAMNEILMHDESPEVTKHLKQQGRWMIRSSDLDAYAYGVHETLANVAEIIVIMTLVLSAYTTGEIMINLTYVYKLFTRANCVGTCFLHLKILENYSKFLNESQPGQHALDEGVPE